MTKEELAVKLYEKCEKLDDPKLTELGYTPLQDIYIQQTIEVAAHRGPEINLPRVLAMTLVSGLVESLPDDDADELLALIRENEWANGIYEEYVQNKTAESEYVGLCDEACYELEYNGSLTLDISPSDTLGLSEGQLGFINDTIKRTDKVRAGWLFWDVVPENGVLENERSHMMKTQTMTLIRKLVYKEDFDVEETILMGYISHLDADDVPISAKNQTTAEARREMFANALLGLETSYPILNTYDKLKEGKTKEATVARVSGKLVTDSEAKDYRHCVDLPKFKKETNELVRTILKSGATWLEMWFKYSSITSGYDEIGLKLMEYLQTH